MPSMMPTANVDAPSTVTMNSGNRLWMSSDETSISIDTSPSVQTLAGMRDSADFFIARRAVSRAVASGGRRRALRRSLRKIECRGEIAHWRARAGQRLQTEAARDEFDDRRRVVLRVVDVTAPGERRTDQRRNARAGSPTIAGGRRNVVPEAAVLVVGDDDRRRRPQRARLDARQQRRDVLVAGQDIGIPRMLVQHALGLVERDLREFALVDAGDQVLVVFQMAGAVRRPRREAREIVERLMMRDEIRRAVGARRDD